MEGLGDDGDGLYATERGMHEPRAPGRSIASSDTWKPSFM